MPLVPFTFGTLVSRAAQPQSKKKTSLLDDDDPFSTFESLSGVQPEPLPAPKPIGTRANAVSSREDVEQALGEADPLFEFDRLSASTFEPAKPAVPAPPAMQLGSRPAVSQPNPWTKATSIGPTDDEALPPPPPNPFQIEGPGRTANLTGKRIPKPTRDVNLKPDTPYTEPDPNAPPQYVNLLPREERTKLGNEYQGLTRQYQDLTTGLSGALAAARKDGSALEQQRAEIDAATTAHRDLVADFNRRQQDWIDAGRPEHGYAGLKLLEETATKSADAVNKKLEAYKGQASAFNERMKPLNQRITTAQTVAKRIGDVSGLLNSAPFPAVTLEPGMRPLPAIPPPQDVDVFGTVGGVPTQEDIEQGIREEGRMTPGGIAGAAIKAAVFPLSAATAAFRAAPTAAGEQMFDQPMPGHQDEPNTFLGRLKSHAHMILTGEPEKVAPIGPVQAATNPPDTNVEDYGGEGGQPTGEFHTRGRFERGALEVGRRGLDMVAQILTDPVAVASMGLAEVPATQLPVGPAARIAGKVPLMERIGQAVNTTAAGALQGDAGRAIGVVFGAEGLRAAAETASNPQATPEDVALAVIGAAVATLPLAAHELVPAVRQRLLDAQNALLAAAERARNEKIPWAPGHGPGERGVGASDLLPSDVPGPAAPGEPPVAPTGAGPGPTAGPGPVAPVAPEPVPAPPGGIREPGTGVLPVGIQDRLRELGLSQDDITAMPHERALQVLKDNERRGENRWSDELEGEYQKYLKVLADNRPEMQPASRQQYAEYAAQQEKLRTDHEAAVKAGDPIAVFEEESGVAPPETPPGPGLEPSGEPPTREAFEQRMRELMAEYEAGPRPGESVQAHQQRMQGIQREFEDLDSTLERMGYPPVDFGLKPTEPKPDVNPDELSDDEITRQAIEAVEGKQETPAAPGGEGSLGTSAAPAGETPAPSAPPAPKTVVETAHAKIDALEPMTDGSVIRRVPFQQADAAVAQKYYAARDFSKARIETIPLSKIRVTQESITPAVAKQYAEVEHAETLPTTERELGTKVVAVERDGEYYLAGGTHRAVAQWARGADSISAVVMPVDEAKLAPAAPPASRPPETQPGGGGFTSWDDAKLQRAYDHLANQKILNVEERQSRDMFKAELDRRVASVERQAKDLVANANIPGLKVGKVTPTGIEISYTAVTPNGKARAFTTIDMRDFKADPSVLTQWGRTKQEHAGPSAAPPKGGTPLERLKAGDPLGYTDEQLTKIENAIERYLYTQGVEGHVQLSDIARMGFKPWLERLGVMDEESFNGVVDDAIKFAGVTSNTRAKPPKSKPPESQPPRPEEAPPRVEEPPPPREEEAPGGGKQEAPGGGERQGGQRESAREKREREIREEKAKAKAERDAAAQRIKDRLKNQTNVGIDPAIVKDMVVILRSYLKEGLLDFEAATLRMRDDYGEPFVRQVGKYLEATWKILRKEEPGAGAVDRVLRDNPEGSKVGEEPENETGGPVAGQPDAGVAGAAEPGGAGSKGVLGEVPAGTDVRPEGAGTPGARPGDQGGVAPEGVLEPAASDPGAGTPPTGDLGPVPGGALSPAGNTDLDPGHAPADYHLTPERIEGIINRGAVQRAKDNLAAIRIIKTLEAERRFATLDEQHVLAKYVGWGDSAVAEYLGDRADPSWSKPVKQLWQDLQTELTKEQRQKIAGSTVNAHFTYDLYQPIWDALTRFGFQGGRVLEPAVGTGHAFGFMPAETRAASTLNASELEPFTAAIAAALYPSARVQPVGYEQVRIPRNTQDVIISNVPFGDYPVVDSSLPDNQQFLTKSIHNYFFAKALQHVRPGGYIVFVTSRYTMDGQEATKVRRFLMSQAHLVGAVRLPNVAFKGSAKTDVVTDLIVLQKRMPDDKGPSRNADLFIESPLNKTLSTVRPGRAGLETNNVYRSKWYDEHPELILGKEDMSGKMYQGGGYNVTGTDRLPGMLKTALESFLPENGYAPATTEATNETMVEGSYKPGEFRVADGSDTNIRIQRVSADGSLVDATPRRVTNVETGDTVVDEPMVTRIRGMIGIRDALRNVIETMRDQGSTDVAVKKSQQMLQDFYEEFVKNHGSLNTLANRRAFELDPEATNLQALEILKLTATPVVDKNGKKTIKVSYVVQGLEPGKKPDFTKMADIFTQRTIQAPRVIEHVDTPFDALLASLGTKTRIDWPYMARITGTPVEDLQRALRDEGRAYEQPDGSWVPSDEYLSGDVVSKLEDVRAAAEEDPERYAPNLKALEGVQPAPKTKDDLAAGTVAITLGSHWVPPADVSAFVRAQLPRLPAANAGYAVRLDGSEAFTRWTTSATKEAEDLGKRHPLAVPYGPKDAHTGEQGYVYGLIDLMNDALNLQMPDLGWWEGRGDDRHYVKDPEGTKAARANLEELRRTWMQWVYENEPVQTRLLENFNTRFNRTVNRKFDGSHLANYTDWNPETKTGVRTAALPGLALPFPMFPHQLNVVWRALSTGNTLAAHEVGAGKTYAMAIIAMEMRRTGRARKPMITVPTNLLAQWRADILRAYPSAKVLAFDEKDLSSDKRQKAMARIAFGDWDIVLVPHSSFELLNVSDQRMIDVMQRWVDELMDAERAAKAGRNDDDASVKKLAAVRKKLEAKIAKKLDALDTNDKALTWEQLGVDALLVDEAHSFKNLYFFSKMDAVRGVARSEADKSLDMFVKIQDINEQSDYRNLVLATATPIMNSMAELYTMQRYLQPQRLRELGLENFDNWYQMFASALPTTEQRPDGTYHEVMRVRDFRNLNLLYKTIADVMDYVGWQDMPYLKLPKVKGGFVNISETDPHPLYPTIQQWFTDRLQAIRDIPPHVDHEGLYVAPERMHPLTGQGMGRPDNILTIMNDAKKAAIDLRLVLGSDVTDFEGSRLQTAADEIAKVYKEETANRGTQLIFLDAGTPKTVEPLEFLQGVTVEDTTEGLADELDTTAPEGRMVEGDEIDLYNEVKKLLIKRGIPSREIAFIHQARNAGERLALFDAMRRGEVRVMIASTDKGGVGMNVQDRLAQVWHMDAPRYARPGDVRQRDGRGIRQGNMYDEIAISRSVTKGTTDEWLYGLLNTKSTMVTQFMKGELSNYTEDDPSTMSIEEAQIRATGDPRGIELTELRAALPRLEAQAAASERSAAKARADASSAEARKGYLQKDLKDLQAWLPNWTSKRGEGFAMSVDVEGKPQAFAGKLDEESRKAVIGAIEKSLNEVPTGAGWALEYRKIGEIGGLTIQAARRTYEARGKDTLNDDVYLVLDERALGGDSHETLFRIEAPKDGAVSMKGIDPVARIVNHYEALPGKEPSIKSAIAKAEEEYAAAMETLSQPSPAREKAAAARQRIAAIENELAAEGKAKDAATKEQLTKKEGDDKGPRYVVRQWVPPHRAPEVKEVKTSKTNPDKFDVKHGAGVKEVAGVKIGKYFGVYRMSKGKESLTHLPTGMALAIYPERAHAVAVGTRLEQMGGDVWNQIDAEALMKGLPEHVKAEAQRLRDPIVAAALAASMPKPAKAKGGGGGPASMPATSRPAAPAGMVSNVSMPLPRPKGPAVPVTARMAPGEIVKNLSAAFGKIPVNVRRFRQRAYGIYKPDWRAVRTAIANDLQTIAHEFGHHVAFSVLRINAKDKAWRGELMALGQNTSRPSYSDKQIRDEGEAEFFRLYMTEPSEAQAAAPNYFAEFERRLKLEPDDLWGTLQRVREDLQGLISQDPATRGMLRIDFKGQDKDQGGFFRTLRTDPRGAVAIGKQYWVDDLQALKDAVGYLKDLTGKPLMAMHDAYILARNARGAAGVAEGFLDHGPRGVGGRFLGPSFSDAISGVKDHLEDFAGYLVARRVVEVRVLKGKDAMPLGEAQAIIKKIEARPDAAAFKDAARKIYEYQDGILEYARQNGVLSDDQVIALRKELAYVPLQRVMDEVSAQIAGAGAKRYANRKAPIRAMSSRTTHRTIVNPLESIIRNTFAMVSTVESNKAAAALVDLAQQKNVQLGTGAAQILERVPNPMIPVQFNLAKVRDAVKAEVEAQIGEDLPDNFELDKLVTIFMPQTFALPGQNLITVLRKGRREFYEVHDQPVFDALTALGVKAAGPVMRFLEAPARVLRAGATLTPGFIARNPIRDTVVAALQSRYGFIPLVDTFRGMVSLAKQDDFARLFKTSGVQQSALVGLDRDRVRREIAKMSETDKKDFFKRIIKNPVELLRLLSENFESATRMGEYRLAIEARGQERRSGILGMAQRLLGVTGAPGQPFFERPGAQNLPAEEVLTRATLAARDVTTDFSRGGWISRELNRVDAFFNARVQGFVRMAETVARDPLSSMINVALLAGLSALLWFMHENDDEWEERPDWEKNAYWHIRIGKHLWKVAKPFEWAGVANLTESMLSWIKKNDHHALERLEPTDPKQLLFPLATTALVPLLEAIANYDSFRDRVIVSPWAEKKDPELQYSDWTTESAKALGKLTGLSPAKIDHVVFGYGAGFARGIIDYGTDPALNLLGLSNKAKDPSARIQRQPLVGTFVTDPKVEQNAQSIQNFYQEYRAVEQYESSLKDYQKQGLARARERTAEAMKEPWFPRIKQIKSTKEQLEGMGREVDAVYKNGHTPEQKRQELDRIYERMVNAARVAIGKRPLRH